MRTIALAALAAAISLLTWLGGALAAAPPLDPTPETAPPRRIQVRIAGEPAEREALTRVLVELMQRVSVEMEVEASERADLTALLAPEAVAEAYLARCLLDLSSPTQAALLVHDPARDRVLERRFARRPGDDELAREELGHMLLAAVEGLLSGAALGAPRSEVVSDAATAHVAVPPPPSDSEAEPEPVATEPSGRGFGFATALLYEAAVLGHDPGFTHGPELAVVFRAPLQPVIGLQLSAQYQLPYELDAEPVGMRVQAFPLRALATIETELLPKVILRFGLGAGADIVALEPIADRAGQIDAAPSRTLALGVARAMAGVEVKLTRALALWAALAADMDLDRTAYLLEHDDGATTAIAEPWRVRPALALGLALP